MKLLRIWIVVLLAVLLPIRGAMAAVMPCAPSSGVSQAEMHVQVDADEADGHRHHAGHGDAVQAGEHAAHDHDDPSSPDHDHASQKCNMCSASCSVPPMPAASAGLIEPTVLTEASYPELAAPAPTFQSDGQERPPRTL